MRHCIFLEQNVKLHPKYLFVHSKVLTQDFMRLSLPALCNDVSWSVAFSMYSVILGHLGTDAVAANSLVVVVRNIGTVFCLPLPVQVAYCWEILWDKAIWRSQRVTLPGC